MINKILSYGNTHKGSIVFSILRYIELFITSLVLFLLAKRLGTVEYGKTVKDFLYITMVPFLAVGVAQSMSKHYSKSNDEIEKNNILLFPLFVYALITPLAVLLGYFYLAKSTWLLITIVGILNLIRNYFIPFFRLRNRNTHSNIAGLIYITCFFSMFYFYCYSSTNYFKINLLSILIFLTIAIVLSANYFKSISLKSFKNYIRSNYKILFKDSLKIYLVSVVNIFLLNHGKLIFQYLLLPSELGVLQFYDNISNIATILISTFCIYYQANIISALHKNPKVIKQLSEKFYKMLFLITIVANCLILPICYLLLNHFFIQYSQSFFLITLMFNYRIFLFGTFLLSLFLITFNRELKYLIYTLLFSIVIALVGVALNFGLKSDYITKLKLYYGASIILYLITTILLWFDLQKSLVGLVSKSIEEE